MKLSVVEGIRTTEIAAWAQQHLGIGLRVLSGWAGLCFHGVTVASCVHEKIVVSSERTTVQHLEFR